MKQKTNSRWLIAQTNGGHISYECEITLIGTEELQHFADKQQFDYLCKKGCPNYDMKWSCPPLAPTYLSFVRPYKYILVILMRVNLSEFSYIKQDYLKIKAANSVLKSRLDKVLRLTKKNSEFYISAGSCRLCKPCKKKSQEPCAHPEERTYSFEALGINVSSLTLTLFQKELLWYQNHKLPQYTCVVGGLLTNSDVSSGKIYRHLADIR